MSDTLFDMPTETVAESKPDERKRKDWLNLAAMAKLTNPDPTWHWCSWESVNGGQSVKGSATTEKKSGGMKWLPKSEHDTVIVSDADLQAQRDKYEAETGNCSECEGTKEQWAGWNHETGHKWKPCTKCGATGKAVRA